jgi:serine/threonine protein kinase
MLPGDTFSHYRILRKIGQGGTGEIFLAQDAILNRNVALKFPSATAEKQPDLHSSKGARWPKD